MYICIHADIYIQPHSAWIPNTSNPFGRESSASCTVICLPCRTAHTGGAPHPCCSVGMRIGARDGVGWGVVGAPVGCDVGCVVGSCVGTAVGLALAVGAGVRAAASAVVVDDAEGCGWETTAPGERSALDAENPATSRDNISRDNIVKNGNTYTVTRSTGINGVRPRGRVGGAGEPPAAYTHSRATPVATRTAAHVTLMQ